MFKQKSRLPQADGIFLVGVQGIEPCLPAPKAGVLPVYDTPLFQFKLISATSENYSRNKAINQGRVAKTPLNCYNCSC